MKVNLYIRLKKGVLDPEGKAIQQALIGLGFSGVNDVRQSKFIELDLDETDPEIARSSVELMCEKLLANTIIEDYEVTSCE